MAKRRPPYKTQVQADKPAAAKVGVMAHPQMEFLPPARLRHNSRNPRKRSKKQVRQIATSIERFGFTNPVLIDEDCSILAGHGRAAAAELLGLQTVPCLRIENMTAAEKRAYLIADNKLAANAGWDEEILAEEFEALLLDDPTFDLTLTGFSIAETDALIEGLVPPEPNATVDEILPANVASRCQQGDVWQLGLHRLVCGDALAPAVLKQLLGDETADMVFTDPPYNVPVNGHVGGSGKIKHSEFAMASGEMSAAEFTRFLRTAFERLTTASRDGSIHFICMDWRHLEEVLAAGKGVYTELKNLIVWVKDNGGMGTFYRSRHELIFAFKRGQGPHTNTFELGQHGRNRTNVWSYRGVNGFGTGRLEELTLHPTVKPVQMIADAIKDVSKRGAIVLDLFGGSGSTLIAAEKTGRRARVCEINPTYCDRIIARWEAYAHDEAVMIERTQRR